MTISEFQIQLDLNKEDITALLCKYASWIYLGYFFVDSNDGQCYLFDKNGKLDDIDYIIALYEGYIKKDIKKIVIPHSIKAIGSWAFEYCESLTSIKIPNSVESIGEGAFWNCKSLTSIEIPNSVENIGYVAFQNCDSLTSIKISDSVKSIGKVAFRYCNSLTSLLFKGKTMSEVKEMKYYPWGIEDESVIKCS